MLSFMQSALADAGSFDIGLDGETPIPSLVASRLKELSNQSVGRVLSPNELAEFQDILKKHGWPTYRTSGPEIIEICGDLLRRSGQDFSFQRYMLRLLDQQVGDDIRPAAYARIADNIYAAHEDKQLYGTLWRLDGDRALTWPPIKSEDGMLFFRDFYGMPSLDEELAAISKASPDSYHNVYEGALAQPSATYSRPDIRRTLGDLIYLDQQLRNELSKAKAKGDEALSEKVREKIVAIDRENLSRLKAIFDEVGFPTREMVGIDGVSTAFLLVQHADEDPLFQRHALALAEPLMRQRQMSRRQFAMLSDRVSLAFGEPQVYGTQMVMQDGKYVLQPTIDIDNLDSRRKEMALGPHLKMLESANSDEN